ncbi:Hypothetical protein, predicted transmembrane protein [Metamycoplasma alkalescens 14918]|uniref:Uncharacterized protein n=1 Tax=Metamycoplasma alkalescens 14918 TaxID=1188234 RepID=N9UAF8_9BACT|nr:hypothetical protein [Metamycoplasma alkalescens]ENY53903.1 Hypothetical protein, predicted transmembrane protein [Metamycoplasma alkalescens 14918]
MKNKNTTFIVAFVSVLLVFIVGVAIINLLDIVFNIGSLTQANFMAVYLPTLSAIIYFIFVAMSVVFCLYLALELVIYPHLKKEKCIIISLIIALLLIFTFRLAFFMTLVYLNKFLAYDYAVLVLSLINLVVISFSSYYLIKLLKKLFIQDKEKSYATA